MDDKFVHEAVLETLDLLVSAIEQITTRAVKFADDSVVDNSSLYAATLEEINRDLLGLFGNFESGTHDDFHGNTDSNAVDNSEGRFAATESAASESFQHSDSYWNEVCLEDEVEYQETCSTTKVWLNSELTSLNERAVRREQLAKLIKLENNAVSSRSLPLIEFRRLIVFIDKNPITLARLCCQKAVYAAIQRISKCIVIKFQR